MAPWWKWRHRSKESCSRCGSDCDVRHSLCRACRSQVPTEETHCRRGTIAESAPESHYHQPSLEPPHDRPWVHRGGG